LIVVSANDAPIEHGEPAVRDEVANRARDAVAHAWNRLEPVDAAGVQDLAGGPLAAGFSAPTRPVYAFAADPIFDNRLKDE
jgi:hypothetical protein